MTQDDRAASDMALPPDISAFVARLQQRGADIHPLAGALAEPYAQDASALAGPVPPVVLRPRRTADAALVLGLCHAEGRQIVVQGGRTGLVGGARPRPGEIALSTERMRDISPPEADGTLVVGAGATLQAVQDVAAMTSLQFGIDIGSRGTATVGGAVATNAGGIHAMRYGMMRAQVVGLEAVLPDGAILSSLDRLMKDNAGPDLSRMFIGSEGILGIVTQVRLRLHPAPTEIAVALARVPGLAAALTMLDLLRARLGKRLAAFEGIWPNVYAGVAAQRGKAPLPPGPGLFIIAQLHGFDAQDHEAFEEALAEGLDQGLATDIILGRSHREMAEIWAMREGANEWALTRRPLVGLDISLPRARMVEFVTEAEARLQAASPDGEALIYGHLGDGNLHFLLRSPAAKQLAPVLYRLVADMGGSPAAEHGIGVDKHENFRLARGAHGQALLQSLKQALDPAGILNPDRVFPSGTPRDTSSQKDR